MERKKKENKFGIHVKAIVFDQNENILTLKRTNNGDDEWDLPGGQVKFGENVYNTVWRAVKEQTDLDVDIEGPSNVWTLKVSEHLHTVCISFRCTWFPYLVSAEESDKDIEDSERDDDDPVFLSTDFADYEWLSPEDILDGDFPVWMKDEIKIIEDE